MTYLDFGLEVLAKQDIDKAQFECIKKCIRDVEYPLFDLNSKEVDLLKEVANEIYCPREHLLSGEFNTSAFLCIELGKCADRLEGQWPEAMPLWKRFFSSLFKKDTFKKKAWVAEGIIEKITLVLEEQKAICLSKYLIKANKLSSDEAWEWWGIVTTNHTSKVCVRLHWIDLLIAHNAKEA